MNFYDHNGKPIAYLSDDKHIFLFSGEPVAYFSDDSIYGFNGKYLGWFKDGWIIARDGTRVFFTENSIGGPMKPMKKMKPIKSMKQMKPMKSIKEIKPIKSITSLSWSTLSGTSFFKQ
ncbi:4-fold beta flower protein [Enterococcus gallinarum]|uniref:4-fold beta flower protein n=1 Tax=Enterococcus gallinarum TaxID=1353 RepID=UPI0035D5480A